MAAPSARNSQPWKFYIVKNAEKRSELVKIFRDFNAPVMVVVAGDMSKQIIKLILGSRLCRCYAKHFINS